MHANVCIWVCLIHWLIEQLQLKFFLSIIHTIRDPTLPLHLQDVWGLNSAKVGLVFLVSVVLALFCELPMTKNAGPILTILQLHRLQVGTQTRKDLSGLLSRVLSLPCPGLWYLS